MSDDVKRPGYPPECQNGCPHGCGGSQVPGVGCGACCDCLGGCYVQWSLEQEQKTLASQPKCANPVCLRRSAGTPATEGPAPEGNYCCPSCVTAAHYAGIGVGSGVASKHTQQCDQRQPARGPSSDLVIADEESSWVLDQHGYAAIPGGEQVARQEIEQRPIDLGDDPDGDIEFADYPPFPGGTR